MSILGQTKINKEKHLLLVVCTQQTTQGNKNTSTHTQQKSVFSVQVPHKNTTFMFFYGLEALC